MIKGLKSGINDHFQHMVQHFEKAKSNQNSNRDECKGSQHIVRPIIEYLNKNFDEDLEKQLDKEAERRDRYKALMKR